MLLDGKAQGAVVVGEALVPIAELNRRGGTDLPETLDALLASGRVPELRAALEDQAPEVGASLPVGRATWAPLVSRPRLVWGVGLNFRAHAKDLGAERTRDLPTGFLRPASCLAAAGSTLHPPRSWGTITGEAEIGLVVAKPLWRAGVDEARAAVAGYSPVLDLTAEELLRRDARYIGRAKAFPESVVLGPVLVTPDEWEPDPDTRIATLWNGRDEKAGHVREMTWDPWRLLSDFSHVFPWNPGDVLQTGTPGAVALEPGGTLGADVEGLGRLECRIGLAP